MSEFEFGGVSNATELEGFDYPETDEAEIESSYLAPRVPVAETVWSGMLDHAADVQAFKESLPPAGTYEVTELTSNFDAGNPIGSLTELKDGRTLPMITYFAIGLREGNTARIYFRLCPVKAYKEGTTGSLLWAYTFYLQARKAYRLANGIVDPTDTRPNTFEELDGYLTGPETKKVRISQTDSGFMSVGLDGVRS